MNFVLIALISLTASYATGLDSIGFFYSPKKINILLNERGYQSRLAGLMDAVEGGKNVLIKSIDEDIKLGCARIEEKTTCTFTFTPSKDVVFGAKELFVSKDISQLGLDPRIEYSMIFRGSMKDQMNFKIMNGILTVSASKK